MKKIFMVLVGSLLLIYFLVSDPYKDAKASILLEPYVQKKYDLDGDKNKERIYCTVTTKNDLIERVDVSVNEIVFLNYTNDNKSEIYRATVSIYDFNPKDKHKEIVIHLISEFEHTYYAYRYQDNDFKLLFKAEDYYIDFQILSKQKSGNKVLVYDSVTCALGNHVQVKKNYKIKNKRLVEVTPKSQIYKVRSGYNYTAAKPIKVFESADGKNYLKTISAGTDFTITKIKCENGSPLYALIDVGSEKSVGWINIKSYEGDSWSDPLVENPGFAG